MADAPALPATSGGPSSTVPPPGGVAGRPVRGVAGGPARRTGGGPGRRGRGTGRRDAGQASIEYLGVLACVAVVIGAMVAPSETVGYHISRGIRFAICRIAGGDCSEQSLENAPTSECTINQHSVQDSWEIVIGSIKVGGDQTVTESMTYDKDGKPHFYLQVAGKASAGVEFGLGEEVKVGDAGEGVKAVVKASLTGGGGKKYEFESREKMDAAVKSMQDSRIDGYLSTINLFNIHGNSGSVDWPPPIEEWAEGGAAVGAEASVTAGVVTGKAGAGISGVIGVKKNAKNGNKTTYLKLSADAAAKLGVANVVEGNAGVGGEVVLGLTYDKKGKPTAASVDVSGNLKASIGPSAELGGVSGGGQWGIGEKGTLSLSVDLTKGDNANVVADALHSMDIPLLLNEGHGGKDPVTGAGDFFKLFRDGAPGAVATATTSTSKSTDFSLGGKLALGLTFGAQYSHNTTDTTTTSGSYFLPGQGWVTWGTCY